MYRSYGRIIIAILVLFTGRACAQDIEFSQPYMSAIYMNPANTGVFSNEIRGSVVYRNQWTSVQGTGNGYDTYAGTVDLSLHSGEANHLGLGLMVYKDNAGVTALSNTDVAFSASYNMALRREKDYYLSVGLQWGFVQESVDINQMTFGTQYVNSQYNSTNFTYENFVGTYHPHYDASLGALWYHYKTPRKNQYIGFAIEHINKPSISLDLNDNDYLYRKYTLTLGLQNKLAENTDIMPQVNIWKQGPEFQLYGGTLFKFVFKRKDRWDRGTGFAIGPYYRIIRDQNGFGSDALVAAARLDEGPMTIGLSYDVNVSSAVNFGTGARGATEISLIYEYSRKANPNDKYRVHCPDF